MDDEEQRAQDSILWRTIWSIPVPNKIKNLMWRACRNSLPTKENLMRQTVIDCPTCDCCKQVLESTLQLCGPAMNWKWFGRMMRSGSAEETRPLWTSKSYYRGSSLTSET